MFAGATRRTWFDAVSVEPIRVIFSIVYVCLTFRSGSFWNVIGPVL